MRPQVVAERESTTTTTTKTKNQMRSSSENPSSSYELLKERTLNETLGSLRNVSSGGVDLNAFVKSKNNRSISMSYKLGKSDTINDARGDEQAKEPSHGIHAKENEN